MAGEFAPTHDASSNEAQGGSIPPQTPSASPSRIPTWAGIAIVLALTFAVYIPTLRYGFVHDDRGQILENPSIHSWRFLPTYFTEHVWAGIMPDEWVNYYRPFFLLWVRINEVIFGTRAWGWHLTTILTHVLTTLLVYLLALRLEIERDTALLVAWIFGLHPAHIEAVAWISGVNEPLLGIFLIGAILAYVHARGVREHAALWKASSLILFASALLMKENALALPGLLLVYEWIFGTEWGKPITLNGFLSWCREAFARTWPYFAVLALYIPARIYALKGFSHNITPLTAAQLIYTWPSLIEFWILHLLWPVGLSSYYNFRAVVHPTLGNFAIPAIFDIVLGLAIFAFIRKSRPAAFFAVWLIVPLIPLLNLRVFIANDFAHDRHLYLPSIGFSVLVAILLKKLCVGQPRWWGMPASLFAVVLCLTVAMSYATATESFYFKDNLTFYGYALTRAPHNPDAESNYASILGEQGDYSGAIQALLDAIHYNPTYWTPEYNLALTYYKAGDWAKAEEHFIQAIRLNPIKPDEYFYLGMERFKAGRPADAVAPLRQAIAFQPSGLAYHLALGLVLKSLGDSAGALREFKLELQYYPQEQAAAQQAAELERSGVTGP